MLILPAEVVATDPPPVSVPSYQLSVPLMVSAEPVLNVPPDSLRVPETLDGRVRVSEAPLWIVSVPESARVLANAVPLEIVTVLPELITTSSTAVGMVPLLQLATVFQSPLVGRKVLVLGTAETTRSLPVPPV